MISKEEARAAIAAIERYMEHWSDGIPLLENSPYRDAKVKKIRIFAVGEQTLYLSTFNSDLSDDLSDLLFQIDGVAFIVPNQTFYANEIEEVSGA